MSHKPRTRPDKDMGYRQELDPGRVFFLTMWTVLCGQLGIGTAVSRATPGAWEPGRGGAQPSGSEEGQA